MYVTVPARDRSELWVSDIDGGNKVKIATGEELGTGTWAPDNFHLSFGEQRTGAGDKVYIVGADGSGLRQLPRTVDVDMNSVWSPDQKSVYVSGLEKGSHDTDRLEMERGRLQIRRSSWTTVATCRMVTPAGSTCLASYQLEKRLESTRCPSPIGNASHCFQV